MGDHTTGKRFTRRSGLKLGIGGLLGGGLIGPLRATGGGRRWGHRGSGR